MGGGVAAAVAVRSTENRREQSSAVLSYCRSGEPQAERLPFWKVILLALFFVPPVVFLVLLLLANNR